MSWAPDSWWWRQSEAFSRQQCGQVLKGLEHKDDSPSADLPTEWSGSCSTKWQMFCCSNISRSELVKLVQESFMARFLFVRKGVKLLLGVACCLQISDIQPQDQSGRVLGALLCGIRKMLLAEGDGIWASSVKAFPLWVMSLQSCLDSLQLY